MATKVVPVFNIRNITDKDEVIVDILISTCSEDNTIREFNAGLAIINLKNGACTIKVGVSFLNSQESNEFVEIVKANMVELRDFMQEQRGLNEN